VHSDILYVLLTIATGGVVSPEDFGSSGVHFCRENRGYVWVLSDADVCMRMIGLLQMSYLRTLSPGAVG